jgi:hypothetical protein
MYKVFCSIVLICSVALAACNLAPETPAAAVVPVPIPSTPTQSMSAGDISLSGSNTVITQPTGQSILPESAQCVAPDRFVLDSGITYVFQWTQLHANDAQAYITDNETFYYQMSADGVNVLMKKENDEKAPHEFSHAENEMGRLFIAPLSDFMGKPTGPLFFFVCWQGGGYVDDTRAVPKP